MRPLAASVAWKCAAPPGTLLQGSTSLWIESLASFELIVFASGHAAMTTVALTITIGGPPSPGRAPAGAAAPPGRARRRRRSRARAAAPEQQRRDQDGAQRRVSAGGHHRFISRA